MSLVFPGGVNNYVKDGDVSPASIELSISLWVWLDTVTGQQSLVSKTDEYQMFAFGDDAYFTVKVGGSVFQAHLDDSLSTGSWIHIVGWRVNQAGTNMFVEVDGVGGTTVGSLQGTINDNANDFYMGVFESGGRSQPFDGRLAQIAIWTRALTSGERAILRTLGKTPDDVSDTDRLAYWPANDGSGSTVTDEENSFDGTLFGNVTWGPTFPPVPQIPSVSVVRNLRDGVLTLRDGAGNHTTITLDSGGLKYGEATDPKLIKDRGALSHLRKGDDKLMDVGFAIQFHDMYGQGTDVRAYEALKKLNNASSWTSTRGEDVYTLTLDFDVLGTGNSLFERISFRDFWHETIKLEEGEETDWLTVTGKAFRTQPTVTP